MHFPWTQQHHRCDQMLEGTMLAILQKKNHGLTSFENAQFAPPSRSMIGSSFQRQTELNFLEIVLSFCNTLKNNLKICFLSFEKILDPG